MAVEPVALGTAEGSAPTAAEIAKCLLSNVYNQGETLNLRPRALDP